MKTVELREFVTNEKVYMIAPIGLSFGLGAQKADVFFLQAIGNTDSPLRFNEKMVAFREENVCRSAIERLRGRLPENVQLEQNYDFVVDIPEAIRLVNNENIDQNAVVLNLINTMLDVVKTSHFQLPEEYRILLAMADRLTFKEDFSEFTQVRGLLLKAMIWCAGVATLELMIVESLDKFDTLVQGLSCSA
jgi:hypothetical protein